VFGWYIGRISSVRVLEILEILRATTAGELLPDCQALEYDPHPGHTSKQHIPRIDSATTEIGAIGSALVGIRRASA
jgi:hypothetical protein